MKRIKLTNKNKEEAIQEAVRVLKEGGLIIYPTETCYGVGVDATNQKAVDAVLKYKSRREGKPLSVAVTDLEMAKEYAVINEIAENLYDNYLPGPITIVSKGLNNLSQGIQSEYGTLGIRVPDHDLILGIVKKLNKPVTSTSANVAYKKTPYDIDELLEDLPQKQKESISLILDTGRLQKNTPSTVVDTTLNNLNVMRDGEASFLKDLKKENILLKANTFNTKETINFGSLVMLKYFDLSIKRPLILALKGELGTGKTQFSKGIAQALKIEEDISSPTYTIIDEYKYEVNNCEYHLVHMDTWRVDGVEEFLRTGLQEYLKPGNIIVIEWADKFYNELLDLSTNVGAKLLKVDFKYTSETTREIKVYEE